MVEIRDFTPFLTETELGESRGLRVNAIQIRRSFAERFSPEELAARFNGRPIILDEPVSVMAMEFDPYGETGERRSRFPIIFVVTHGSGFVRIGGESGDRRAIAAGQAVLWPSGELFKAWAGAAGMKAIGVECLSTVP
ncbi:MAG: cupin domain-containing protein [Chloroflexota bacterium]|nr:cupin domain-containing protein [Dehalococcoidia bacterium]MDW8253678.1 cupin domain-containing protein [Chloroflexota bacterium]